MPVHHPAQFLHLYNRRGNRVRVCAPFLPYIMHPNPRRHGTEQARHGPRANLRLLPLSAPCTSDSVSYTVATIYTRVDGEVMPLEISQ